MDRPVKVEPVSYGPVEAVGRGVAELGRSVMLTLSIPWMVIQGVVPLEFLRPVGPVGLFQATSQATAETVRSGWWFPLLFMAATLGAGLGVANLLPIPGLDGGRLVFVAIEMVRGRRVSPEREGLIHLVGMAVLVSLVIVITYFDILFPVNVDFTLR
jgi:regulator of sigma E protease